MRTRKVLAEYLPRVTTFITTIQAAEDNSERAAELRRVSTLIRFLSAFYEAFLPESFNIRVRGFSYKDKRKVSRQLVRVEMDAASDDGLNETRELAAQFEELSDMFHGSMDFGYSEEDEDYVAFHRDAFPSWLDTLERWLRTTGDENDRSLADNVDDVSKRYADIIEQVTNAADALGADAMELVRLVEVDLERHESAINEHQRTALTIRSLYLTAGAALVA